MSRKEVQNRGMQEITVAAAIIAITQRIKEAFPQVNGLVTLLVAMVLGGIAGYFHIQGVTDVFQGVLIGIAAVGTVTTAQKFAGER